MAVTYSLQEVDGEVSKCEIGGRYMKKHAAIVTRHAFACCSLLSTPAFAQSLSANLPVCTSMFGQLVEERSITMPPVGETRDAEVGASVLSTGKIVLMDAGVTLLEPISFTGTRAGKAFTVNIAAGEYSPADWRAINYPAPAATFRYDGEGKDRKGISKPDVRLWIDVSAGSMLKANVSFGLSSSDYTVDNPRFQVKRCTRTSSKGLRREILYSGAAKGVVTFQYREFQNDYARPAFSQELTFDLADGKEIGFRGARIKVESVTNVGIRYSVVRGLD